MSKEKEKLVNIIFREWLLEIIRILNRELDKAEAEQLKEEKA